MKVAKVVAIVVAVIVVLLAVQAWLGPDLGGRVDTPPVHSPSGKDIGDGESLPDPAGGLKGDSARPIGESPRFEDARIFVWDGEDRAYVGYTIIGEGENQYASPEHIRAVGSDGKVIDWKHQTATGGPADVVAMEGRTVIAPGSRSSGDADYVDASAVKIGETVTVTFKFESGEVDVPFHVVHAN